MFCAQITILILIIWHKHGVNKSFKGIGRYLYFIKHRGALNHTNLMLLYRYFNCTSSKPKIIKKLSQPQVIKRYLNRWQNQAKSSKLQKSKWFIFIHQQQIIRRISENIVEFYYFLLLTMHFWQIFWNRSSHFFILWICFARLLSEKIAKSRGLHFA